MTAAATLQAGIDAFAEKARSFAAAEGGRTPTWLLNLRQNALEAFLKMGFPRPDDEEWRYFNVAPIARRVYDAPDAGTAPPSLKARADTRRAAEALGPLGVGQRRMHQLVFLNGRLDPEASRVDGLPAGVRLASFARLIEREPARLEPRLGLMRGHRAHPFVALNTAFLNDGAFLLVPDRVVVTEPIHVVHVADGNGTSVAAHPRVLIVLGENAQATVLETYVSLGSAFVNPVTEVFVGRQGLLDHYKLQEEGPDTFHVGDVLVHSAPGSQYFSHVFSFGGRLVRNECAVHLHGDGAGTTLDGLFLVRGEQQVDNHTLVDHARPHGGSQQYYKGILDGKARGSFDGRIVVRPAAPKTDAHQKNRNLLLSGEAHVDSKPQLEIHNNDVKCTHGSATGRLDPDALFYLRSRGLDETAARSLLTFAFASEITERVKVTPLRDHLEARLLGWLSGGAPAPEER